MTQSMMTIQEMLDAKVHEKTPHDGEMPDKIFIRPISLSDRFDFYMRHWHRFTMENT